MVKDWKDIKIVSLVFTAWWRKDKVDPKRKEEYFVEFCGWSWDVSVNYIEETMEILWHEVMIWDVIQRLEDKIWPTINWRDDWSPYKWFIATEKLAKLFNLWTDKRLPYSQQSDDCKVALGRIVEEVLSSKKE